MVSFLSSYFKRLTINPEACVLRKITLPLGTDLEPSICNKENESELNSNRLTSFASKSDSFSYSFSGGKL